MICKNDHNCSHPWSIPLCHTTLSLLPLRREVYCSAPGIWTGLTLTNRTLENVTHLRLCKVLAHWNLAIFGIQRQTMWRSPCLHSGQWDLENRAEPKLSRTEVSKLKLTDQIQPTICFGIARAKNGFYRKTLAINLMIRNPNFEHQLNMFSFIQKEVPFSTLENLYHKKVILIIILFWTLSIKNI